MKKLAYGKKCALTFFREKAGLPKSWLTQKLAYLFFRSESQIALDGRKGRAILLDKGPGRDTSGRQDGGVWGSPPSWASPRGGPRRPLRLRARCASAAYYAGYAVPAGTLVRWHDSCREGVLALAALALAKAMAK